MPTLEEAFTRNAGVAFDNVFRVLLVNNLALTPVSMTKLPVVWKRTLSEEDEPLKTKSS
jgi:hypothetical protein